MAAAYAATAASAAARASSCTDLIPIATQRGMTCGPDLLFTIIEHSDVLSEVFNSFKRDEDKIRRYLKGKDFKTIHAASGSVDYVKYPFYSYVIRSIDRDRARIGRPRARSVNREHGTKSITVIAKKIIAPSEGMYCVDIRKFANRLFASDEAGLLPGALRGRIRIVEDDKILRMDDTGRYMYPSDAVFAFIFQVASHFVGFLLKGGRWYFSDNEAGTRGAFYDIGAVLHCMEDPTFVPDLLGAYYQYGPTGIKFAVSDVHHAKNLNYRISIKEGGVWREYLGPVRTPFPKKAVHPINSLFFIDLSVVIAEEERANTANVEWGGMTEEVRAVQARLAEQRQALDEWRKRTQAAMAAKAASYTSVPPAFETLEQEAKRLGRPHPSFHSIELPPVTLLNVEQRNELMRQKAALSAHLSALEAAQAPASGGAGAGAGAGFGAGAAAAAAPAPDPIYVRYRPPNSEIKPKPAPMLELLNTPGFSEEERANITRRVAERMERHNRMVAKYNKLIADNPDLLNKLPKIKMKITKGEWLTGDEARLLGLATIAAKDPAEVRKEVLEAMIQAETQNQYIRAQRAGKAEAEAKGRTNGGARKTRKQRKQRKQRKTRRRQIGM